MQNEKIIVTIQEDGTIQAKTIGMKGERCLDVIDLLETLLQAETTDSAYTDEFHEQATTTHLFNTNELGRK